MSINQTVSNLWAWLETWLDEKGGVHGYVVHHHRDNLRILSSDTWTQALCIMGLLEIYQKTSEEKWLRSASTLCDYLASTYYTTLHTYRNSNFDQKPLGRPALESDALASYALLAVSKEGKNVVDSKLYCRVAKDNILNFLLQRWNNPVGALYHLYHGNPAYVHNKNSMAILALISLAEVENDQRYIKRYAERIGKSILSCQVTMGKLAGAIPYVNNAKDYRTLYTLITSIGLLALHRRTGSSEFLIGVEKAINNLSKFIDYETGLICHYHKVGYPQWIPDTLLFILIASRLKDEGIKVPANIPKILAKVLARQYKSGGFPLSIGFEDLSYPKGLPSKPKIKRWRDLLATPGLNAWNFWALTQLLPQNSSISEPTVQFPLIIETDAEEKEGPYEITEDEKKVVFMDKTKQQVVGIFNKTDEVAGLCLINERGDYWILLESFSKYPALLRRLILALPNILTRT